MDNQFTITEAQYKMMQRLLEKEEKQKAYSRRQTVKNQIILEKAKAQGITATKHEIDARLEKEKGGAATESKIA